MNYLAHGFRYLDQPHFLAGTALPDWYRAAARRPRLRPEMFQPLATHADPRAGAVRRGVLHHMEADRRFHQSASFVTLSLQVTADLRRLVPEDRSFRLSFVGHVLVEMLLDAALMEEDPGLAGRYYASLARVEPAWLEDVLCGVMPPRNVAALMDYAGKFLNVRFLQDYASDEGLLFRLNGLLLRVGLGPLPATVGAELPRWRAQVRSCKSRLLSAA